MTILVDARYIGDVFKHIHHSTGISVHHMMKIMNITGHTLHRYENGQEIVPAETLEKLIRAGFYYYMRDKQPL